MTTLAIILFAILITSVLVFDISCINVSRNEETMKQETTINGKTAYTFDFTDLIIMQRSVELFIKQAKDAEKIMPKELKKTSQTAIKQANKTLRKLKAIRKIKEI